MPKHGRQSMGHLSQSSPRLWLMLICLLVGLGSLFGLPTAQAQSKLPELPLSRALAKESTLAVQKKRPLVVLVSLPGCAYCRIAREHYLYPLHREGKINVVQVDMNGSQTLLNFKGETTTHGAQVRAWRSKVTPTVYFFDDKGQALAEPLEGGYLPDFYASYLDERLKEASRALQ